MFLRECDGESMCSQPLEQQLIPAGMLQPCPGAGAALGLPGLDDKRRSVDVPWLLLALDFPLCPPPAVPIPFPMELLNGAALQQLIRPEVPSRGSWAQICQCPAL